MICCLTSMDCAMMLIMMTTTLLLLQLLLLLLASPWFIVDVDSVLGSLCHTDVESIVDVSERYMASVLRVNTDLENVPPKHRQYCFSTLNIDAAHTCETSVIPSICTRCKKPEPNSRHQELMTKTVFHFSITMLALFK
jgi:hypothetical protein